MTPAHLQKPVMVRVAAVEKESNTFATLFFDHTISFRPGQFIMVWIPGVDEKPYTVSYLTPDRFAITIEAKGLFSKKAVRLKENDLVGIRGPFGNTFDIDRDKKAAVIAGGCGMAPLATLVERLPEDTLLIHGARSEEYLLYPGRFDRDRQFCTDDGSKGHKGFVTDLLEKELDAGRELDRVYACGPEIMMYRVFQLCEKHRISCQVSLERYMRCAFGVCGACVCGDRLVCKDGPVFESEDLRKMADFNTRALLKSGRDVPLDQYVSWRCL